MILELKADAHMSPEARLIVSIIMQAYTDLFLTLAEAQGRGGVVSQVDQDQSIAFLTNESGRFARHRNELCALVGFNGDVLAERVRAMMVGERDFTFAAGLIGPSAESVARIRARYAELNKSGPAR